MNKYPYIYYSRKGLLLPCIFVVTEYKSFAPLEDNGKPLLPNRTNITCSVTDTLNIICNYQITISLLLSRNLPIIIGHLPVSSQVASSRTFVSPPKDSKILNFPSLDFKIHDSTCRKGTLLPPSLPHHFHPLW